MIIDNLLVCPVCRSELMLSQITDMGRVSCSQCQRTYSFENGVYDLTPVPPPDKEVLDKWSLWEQLQENGSIAYTAAPEMSLSVGTRDDAKAFGDFSKLSGLVLDIGCGPQEIPSYGLDFPGQLIGIDPLRGVIPKRFAFVQGIGEYLPFRSGTFDRVLFATSLDHTLHPKSALAEARRVVKLDGTVNVWLGDDEHSDDASDQWTARYERRIRKAASMLRKGDVAGLVARLRGARPAEAEPSHSPEYMEKLKVPDGAVDHFHFFHLYQSEV